MEGNIFYQTSYVAKLNPIFPTNSSVHKMCSVNKHDLLFVQVSN